MKSADILLVVVVVFLASAQQTALTCDRGEATVACANDTAWYRCTGSPPTPQTPVSCPAGTLCKCPGNHGQCPRELQDNPCAPRNASVVQYPCGFFIEISGGNISVASPAGTASYAVLRGALYKSRRLLRYWVDAATDVGGGRGGVGCARVGGFVVVVAADGSAYVVDEFAGTCSAETLPDADVAGAEIPQTASLVRETPVGDDAVLREFVWTAGCSNPGVSCTTAHFTALVGTSDNCADVVPAGFSYTVDLGASGKTTYSRSFTFNTASFIQAPCFDPALFAPPPQCE
eukprot:TRINITY_DN2474_c0_g2_i1.p2 TRINITY_DN2474_c0_g2~~TRINITY_DN2474_c0_g2_i1.p2  ORF type:complete len:289 (-),score=78.87 TRINITY_DN2474_c0_g2_i1:138-1004(-)